MEGDSPISFMGLPNPKKGPSAPYLPSLVLGTLIDMFTHFVRIGLSVLVLNLLCATVSPAEPVEGESLVTPNQQRRAVKVNEDLPKDIVDQASDSPQVAELRGHLREALVAYQKAAKQFGSGTPEARATAHLVLQTQADLHKQFIKEEAIPAVASR